MNYDNLRWEVEDSIATVWLARPPVNSVDGAMYVQIARLFEDVAQLGEGVRAVILTGEGKHFSGGNDLEEFKSLSPRNCGARMLKVRQAFTAVQDCPLPVIGAVRGVALGTGLALAASCDLIVAAAGAKLGVPEISVGVMGGARHLARLVPEQYVRWMYLSGEPMVAEDLAPLGGVLSVVPDARLLEEARERALLITRHSPVAVRFAKHSLNQIEPMELKSGYQFEQSLTAELCGYRDSKEAVAAFFERRQPHYSGD
jgi:enoyl-CoA hydratase